MNLAGLVAFNLLLNGVGSFVVAWLLVRAALRVFRAAPGRAHVVLLALPFVKVVFDLARGVPEQSFLWLRARGVPQDLGSFQLGFGVSWIVPRVQLGLGALSGGHPYTQSAPDLVAAFLTRRVGAWVPPAVALALLLVAAFRLLRRASAWHRAWAERRALERGATLVGARRAGLRRVRIFLSDDVAGSPFTGGVIAPYVVFPRRTWSALRPAERRAALAHEIAHVLDHHVMVTAFAGIVRDVFWFVPFIGAAENSLRAACELAADAGAVKKGSPPALLASALVRVQEAIAAPPVALSPTLGASGASLRARVELLLDAPAPPRFGFQRAWARVALTLWVSAAVLLAVALGNH